MFYRAAGIRHVNYLQTRKLWPLQADRTLLAVIAALFVAAPWLLNSLYLNSYLMPLLLWTSAALGLNLLMGMPVTSDAGLYFVALGVCAILTIWMLNIRRTSFGRALAAIREKDYAAEILGVSAFRYKLLAFWVSSFIGGMVGALYAFCY